MLAPTLRAAAAALHYYTYVYLVPALLIDRRSMPNKSKRAGTHVTNQTVACLLVGLYQMPVNNQLKGFKRPYQCIDTATQVTIAQEVQLLPIAS